MQIVTTDFSTGKEIQTLQMVKGSVVFSKNVVRDVFAGLKTLVGGEIAGYTEMLNDARSIATQRMVDEAAKAINGKRSASLVTALLGLVIFIDDYFNCLTVGTVMRPVTDKFKIFLELQKKYKGKHVKMSGGISGILVGIAITINDYYYIIKKDETGVEIFDTGVDRIIEID